MSIQKFRINNDRASKQPKPTLWPVVVAHVNKLGLSPALTDKILQKAKSISPGAWNHFLANINTHITNLSKAKKTDEQK